METYLEDLTESCCQTDPVRERESRRTTDGHGNRQTIMQTDKVMQIDTQDCRRADRQGYRKIGMKTDTSMWIRQSCRYVDSPTCRQRYKHKAGQLDPQ